MISPSTSQYTTIQQLNSEPFLETS